MDEHRRQLVRAYLEQPELSLAEIAYLLGFTSTPGFYRAFKRWFGETPAAFRAANQH